MTPVGVEIGGADAKENRQQAGNAVLAQGGRNRHSGPSSDRQQDKRLSNKAAASKTRRSARLSETQTSPSSAEQDLQRGAAPPSPDHSIAQDSTADVQVPLSQAIAAAQPLTGVDLHARDSVAESVGSQAAAVPEAGSHESPAVTLVKAPQAAKSSGDFGGAHKSHILEYKKPQTPWQHWFWFWQLWSTFTCSIESNCHSSLMLVL